MEELKDSLRAPQNFEGESSKLTLAPGDEFAAKTKGVELEEIFTRLTRLERSQSELHPAKANPRSIGDADIEKRISTLETRLALLQSASLPQPKFADHASQKILPRDISDLKSRIEKLEQSLKNADEVPHVFQAVRGIQRDVEMNSGKLTDVNSGLVALQSQVEATIPEFFRILEQLVGNGSSKSQPDSDSTTKDLLELLRESLGGCSGPYVSLRAHEQMNEAMERMIKQVQAQMDQLQVQLQDALRGKANDGDLKKMLDQQHALEASLRRLMRAHSPVDDATTEDPACMKVPLLPARCISCDRKVEFTPGKPHPCHASCPSWPHRESACPAHQAAGPPPGYRQRRGPSLPAIDRDRW